MRAPCGELVTGDPRSPNGTNRHAPCTYPARALVVLRVKGGEQRHPCCGVHRRALEKSALYVRTEEGAGTVLGTYLEVRPGGGGEWMGMGWFDSAEIAAEWMQQNLPSHRFRTTTPTLEA